MTKLLVEKDISEIRDATQDISNNVKSLGVDHKKEKIESWLGAPDPSIDLNKALQLCHKDSGRWLLDSLFFMNWKTRRNSFLWLRGIPGCGKTILSSTIIQHLQTAFPSQPVLYFFFTFTESCKQSLEIMIRSLISQLYCTQGVIHEQLDWLFSACANGRQQPTMDSLWATLLQMIQQVGEVWIILDALDECRERDWERTEGMSSWMKDLLQLDKRNVHLLMTSRPEQHIESEIMQWAGSNDVVPIEGDGVAEDIRAYVHTRIRQDKHLKRWRSRPDVQDEIEVRLMKEAAGM